MLSAADFPMVFPWMTEPSPARERTDGLPLPAAHDIARWEDDGGRTRRASARRRPDGPPAPWDVATAQWAVHWSCPWASWM